MSDTCHESLTPDQLDALGDEIATFAVRIDVAEHALLTRLRTFDAHEAWGRSGALSCASWLSWRTGVGIKAAREKVRVARALGELSKIDAAFGRGELSYSKVRAITRVATPKTEQDFLDIAQHTTASQLDRLTGGYRRCKLLETGGSGEPNLGDLLGDDSRYVRQRKTVSGMVQIEMQLSPEEAAVVLAAISSAGTAEQASAGATEQASAGAPDQPCAAQSSRISDPQLREEQRADAIVDVARAYLKHRPRTLGSSHQIVLITTKDLLEQGPDGVGGFMRDGTPVPLHVARMLACDGSRVDVTLGEQGELLDIGRSTRAIPSAIGRALWIRDGGCRVPGCDHKQHLHGHHIHPWAQGGPTSLANLVLVCSAHHRMIHEERLSTRISEGKIVFIDQRGRKLPGVPPSAATGRDLEELDLYLRDADLHIDPSVSAGHWDGEPMDLADSLTWMFIAHSEPAQSARPST